MEEKVSGLIISPVSGLEKSAVFKKLSSEIPVVESNNYHGGYLLGEHLKEVHNAKKAFFNTQEGTKMSSVKERYEGFKKGFKGQVDILEVDDIENLYDSLFFCHDLLTLSGMFVLLRNGYKIPEDIRVVSFDDEIVTKYAFPRITTVRQNFGEIGKDEHIPVELVVRESCRCSFGL